MCHGVGESLKFLVGRGKLGRTFVDAPFEIALCCLESAIAGLDLFKHLVEGLNEEGEFVAAGRDLGADGVIPFARNNLCSFGESGERVSYEMADCRCCDKRDGKADDEHAGRDEAEAFGTARYVAGFSDQVDGSHRSTLELDSASKQDVATLRPIAQCFAGRESVFEVELNERVTQVAREFAAIRAKNDGGADLG